MADNFTANSGSGGETFASDDIGGIQYPRSKIVLGADNTNDGDVSSANPMPVTGTITAVTDITNAITVNAHAVTNAGTFAVQVDGDALTALQLIDDPVATISATPLMRVAIYDASDSQITSFGGGTQHAVDDALGATPTGTLSIAIRDDALSALTPVEGDAVGLRVDANGGLWTQEVNSAAILADTASMDTNLGTLAGAVTGTEMQVDIVSGNVTNAGTFAVQVDGDALTALQLIDDAVYADDADWSDGVSKHMLVGGLYQSAEQSITDGDVGPLSVDSNGRLKISIEADNAGIGGGTQYTEDAAAAADPVGNAQILIRTDTPATVTSTDGDNVAQRGTNYGAAYVQVVDSAGNYIDTFGGSGGTAAADDADFVAGTTQGTPAMGVYESTPSTVTDGDVGIVGIDTNRNLKVSIEADSVGIGGGTQYTEDAAAASDPVGNAMIVVRDDNITSQVDTDGDNVAVRGSPYGALYTAPGNFISTNNSTTSTLGISGVYTGTGDDVSQFTSITIQLDSSHDSAASGMTFQFSIDNTNWDDVYSFTYTAADGARRFQFPVTAQYFRIVYTNGGTGQTHFRVQTILHTENQLYSVHRLGDNTSADRSSQVVKAALLAQINGSGDFTPVASSSAGDLRVSLEDQPVTNTEDNASGNGNGGIPALVVRDDTLAANAEVNADGDYTWLRVDNNGALWVNQNGTVTVDNAGTFATQVDGDALTALQLIDDAVHADDAAFTLGTHKGVMMMGFAGTQSVDANDAAALACDTDGALHVSDGGNTLTVDGTVAATQSGTWNITNVSGTVSLPTGAATQATLADVETNTDFGAVTGGGVEATALRVTIASDSTGTLTVDNAGTFATQVDGDALTALQLIDDPVFADDAAFTIATSKVMVAGGVVDDTSTDSADEGDAAAIRLTPDRKQVVHMQPHTTGGVSISRDIDLDNGTLTVVKASAGLLYGMTITNTSTATVFVKFYNAASGTLGTGTPVLTIGIPGNSTDDTLFSETFPIGVEFSTGICVGAGTGVADADNTDPGANAVVANIFYK